MNSKVEKLFEGIILVKNIDSPEATVVIGWSLFKSKKTLKRDMCFSLTLSSEELRSLNLNSGKNEVIFKVSGINRQLEASIYLCDVNDKIIVYIVEQLLRVMLEVISII